MSFIFVKVAVLSPYFDQDRLAELLPVDDFDGHFLS